MYKELVFRPFRARDQIFYSEVARKIIAQACDQMAINPAIFGRDEHGKILQGSLDIREKNQKTEKDAVQMYFAPSIIFDGGLGFIRLYAVGKIGIELLNSEGLKIISGLQNALGAGKIEFYEGEMDIKEADHPILYAVRNVMVSKKYSDALNPKSRTTLTRSINHFRGVPAVERQEELKSELLKGLISFCRLVEHDVSKDLEGVLPTDEDFDAQILQGDPLPIPVNEHLLAASYKNMVIAMPYELTGPWAFGRMRSKGRGLLRPLRLNDSHFGGF